MDRYVSSSASSSGVGLLGLLFLVFLVLKLTGVSVVATWSWWWVTAPLWFPPVLLLAVFAIATLGLFAFFLIQSAVRQFNKPRRQR